MNKIYVRVYALLALAILVPLGMRLLTRSASQPSAVEPAMAEAGKILFSHEWTADDPLCAGGDGLGPVYNAVSCVACHKQGGVGGSAGLEHNVTVFVTQPPFAGDRRQGVVHAHAVRFQETLKDVDAAFPAISQPPLSLMLSRRGTRFVMPVPQGGCQQAPQIDPDDGQIALALLRVNLSQRNTPALFGANLIDAIPEDVVIAGERSQRVRWAGAPSDGEARPVGRTLRLADGRIGRFGWKAQSASLSDFVRAACAGELGLSNPSHNQPAPLSKPDYRGLGLDLTAQQCDQLTAFVAALPRPVARPGPGAPHVEAGKERFHMIGCAECHTPQLGSVVGLYSDLLLHRMGSDLEGSGSYNQALPGAPESPGSEPLPDEWRTPPLWGVADSGPWLHDGRASTLREAITLHAGQATTAAASFRQLQPAEQEQVLAFLQSMRAP